MFLLRAFLLALAPLLVSCDCNGCTGGAPGICDCQQPYGYGCDQTSCETLDVTICDGGACDQQGTNDPQCCLGYCDQRLSASPECSGGYCRQDGSSGSASCSGGYCTQIVVDADKRLVSPGCIGGHCNQDDSLNPTCEGGHCSQIGAQLPSCVGGYCDQSGAYKAECAGGHCNQESSTGFANCLAGYCHSNGAVGLNCAGGNCCVDANQTILCLGGNCGPSALGCNNTACGDEACPSAPGPAPDPLSFTGITCNSGDVVPTSPTAPTPSSPTTPASPTSPTTPSSGASTTMAGSFVAALVGLSLFTAL